MNDPGSCVHSWPHSNGPSRCSGCGRTMEDLDLLSAVELIVESVKRQTTPPEGWRRDFRSEAYRNEP